ncbi:MAG: ABC transporter permease [Chloroherpetonaceae bacterium]|nr:ABC transporter permease [Chthonomonadaceae bacterium]MDW8207195.1 ABC transporter permease [Chloroherpetonaceae bacterium]
MIHYIVRRLLLAIPTLIAISILSFVIIQLPPGDYLDERIAQLEQQYGDSSSLAQAEQLRKQYGLDRPMPERYWKWVSGFVRGDFGDSFRYEKPVNELIYERLGFTVMLSVGSLLFTYALAIPIGIYSATHRYHWSDNMLTLLAFFGMSLPGFLIALVIIVVVYQVFGVPLFGLFSPYYQQMSGWSWGKVMDLLNHLWVPLIVISLNGTAALMRVMRGNLLDVLGEPFVRTARAKGLKESVVVVRHAARIAINPLISMMGMSLPEILSGTTIVSIVLNLPTVGPLLLQALQDQDMYLAGTIILFMSLLLIIGNLLADIALAWADPRIRYE